MADNSNVPGVQQLLGDAGALPEIKANGKTWLIGFPTQRAKAALEELVTAAAVNEVVSLKPILPPQSYGELMSDLRNAVGAGDYKTWGSGWQRVLAGTDGGNLFLCSLLRERQANATVEDAAAVAMACPDEVAMALARVAPPFYLLLMEKLPVSEESKAEMVAKAAEQLMSRMSATQTASSSVAT